MGAVDIVYYGVTGIIMLFIIYTFAGAVIAAIENVLRDAIGTSANQDTAPHAVYILTPLGSKARGQMTYIWVAGHHYKLMARFNAFVIARNSGQQTIVQKSVTLLLAGE